MVSKTTRTNGKFGFFRVSYKIVICLPALVLFLALSSCQEYAESSSCKQEAKREFFLTAGGLSSWDRKQPRGEKQTGEWEIAGYAFLNSENDNLLSTKPGKGVIVIKEGKAENLLSKAEFGDIEAHIEFMVPKGSNSGVYFAGRYEIQVFDSYGVEEPKHSDCGGIYQRWDRKKREGFEGHAPRVNASKPAGQWQSFDVVFRTPRFDKDGRKIANARFEKVVHNGIVIHENVELTGPTRSGEYYDEKPAGPIKLQGDHGPVAYRHIRIIPLNKK